MNHLASDPAEALLWLIGLAFVCFVCSASIALGCASVCRALKWAPVNITTLITVQKPDEQE